MNRVIVLVLSVVSFVFTGCSISSTSSGNTTTTSPYLMSSNPRTDGLYSRNEQQFVIDKIVTVANARIIQTVNPHFGIAIVPSGLIFAISTSDSFDPFYDDLKIGGQFVMIQTYTYETRGDEYGRTKIKTIPLIVPLRDYKSKSFKLVE